MQALRPLDFRILGPVGVYDGDRSVPLGGGRQRGLLALLVIHRDEALSTDRIVDALWGEHAPASAVNSVHVYISNLRKALGTERVETLEHGYRLVLEPGELDADRFDRLLAEGRKRLASGDPASASDALASALDLCRGAPLAEFAYEDFARAEVQRLEELRLSAFEERIDAQLALGHTDALVPDLERLVAAHPLRERFRRQLMLALYRSGRQADALETYRTGRALMVSELGIEPTRKLQELERAILTQDPALEGSAVHGQPGGRRSRRRSLAAALGAALILGAVGGFAYSATRGSSRTVAIEGNAVAVIDPHADRVVDGIPVGARPEPITYGSGALWVGNLDDETVSRIDPKSHRQLRAISVGFAPDSLAASRDAVWVGGARPSAPKFTIRRIDPQFDVVSGAAQLQNVAPGTSGSLAANGTAVWAAPAFGLLTRLDESSGHPLGAIDPNTSPTAIALDGDAVWLTESVGDTVSKVDGSGVVSSTAVGHGPSGIAVGAGAVWVADTLDDTLLRIDPSTRAVTATIHVGAGPTGVAVGEGAVWVADSHDGTVSKIDPATNRVRRIVVGGSPHSLVVAAGKVWVTVQPQTVQLGAKRGGTVRLSSQQDADFVDSALSFSPLGWQILYATCAKLVNYPDEPAPKGSQLVPEVARSLPTRAEDGKSYVFTIRRGFRFSPPSGQAVTAATFKYSIERSLDPALNSPAQSFLGDVVGAADYITGNTRHISGIVARGDRLEIRLTAPASDLPARLALPFFCAVPIGTPSDPRGLRTIPSAGPYFIASYTPEQGAILERNPNYRGSRPHRLSRIAVVVGTAAGADVKRIESGSLDYLVGGPPPAVNSGLVARYGPESAAAKSGRQQYFVNPQLGLDYFALNTRRPLFANVALRQAVNYAIDRLALARLGSAFTGLPNRPTAQYLPPGIPGFRSVAVYPLRPNLARARRLAGDQPRTAVLYVCNTPPCPQIAAVVRSNLRAIGIDVQVKMLSFTDLYARASRASEPFDMVLVGYVADYADPSDFLNLQLDGRAIGTPNNLDFAQFADPGWLRKLKAAAELSGPARYFAYARLDTELARDAAPWVAIGNATAHDFFSARVGCQEYQPLYGMDLAALCLRSGH